MGSVFILLLLIVAVFVVLCYLFNESRVELDSPTIAAMEAHAEAVQAVREPEHGPAVVTESERRDLSGDDFVRPEAEIAADVPPMKVSDYEYREMLEEGSENYVLPQWMVNFFSSSDLCHTLDASDNVVLIAKLSDARNAETGIIDTSADCDMSTQTVSLKLCLGQGAAAETIGTKFYLFERGDLFELNRLIRQEDLRIDVLTRAADYTLGYACTVHTRVPQNMVTQLRSVLAKIPT